MWTVSGLYFSWTNLDEIHGDHFLKEKKELSIFENLINPFPLEKEQVETLVLKNINEEPYYWVNNKTLIHARTGELKKEILEPEALKIASQHVKPNFKVKTIEKITETGKHHEYRGKPLPVYVITYEGKDKIRAYINAKNGSFESIRHRDWRIFDFLWMTHTMDFEGRDDMNNLLLRIFSLLGVFTVISGFVLWYVSSPSIRKIKKRTIR
ncbi:hypothetical protein GCM10022397_38790 [Flavivirga jejuensis]